MLCLKNQRVGIGVESLSNRQLMVRETSMRDIKILILLKRLKQMLKKKRMKVLRQNIPMIGVNNELPPRPKIPPIYIKIQKVNFLIFFKEVKCKIY